MNNLLQVKVLDCTYDQSQDGLALLLRDFPSPDQIVRKWFTLDKLHHDVYVIVVVTAIVELDYVWVVHRQNDLDLRLK
jgi:hypothetical protein